MVRYYGRAKTITGSVNTKQTGLKMAGCPSKTGRKGYISNYIQKRVNCMDGICGIPLVHGVPWRSSYKNFTPYCSQPTPKCAASAGGIGNINTPYYKTVQPGKTGCGYVRRKTKLDSAAAAYSGLLLTAATFTVGQPVGVQKTGIYKSSATPGIPGASIKSIGAYTAVPEILFTAPVGNTGLNSLSLSILEKDKPQKAPLRSILIIDTNTNIETAIMLSQVQPVLPSPPALVTYAGALTKFSFKNGGQYIIILQ